MLMVFRVPRRWPEVLKRTIAEIGEDNCLGLAAHLAFYFFLALFPALLFLVALVGYLPIGETLTRMLTALGTVAPGEVLILLRAQLEELARGSPGSLLTLGIARWPLMISPAPFNAPVAAAAAAFVASRPSSRAPSMAPSTADFAAMPTSPPASTRVTR
jgi:membrane protein